MRDCNSFDWTPDRCEHLTALWASGLSAKECVLELGGGLSRSSVIGKVHRLNLPQREQDKRSPAGTRAPRQRRPYVRKPHQRNSWDMPKNSTFIKPPTIPLIHDHHIPLEQRRSLLELTDRTCRFPVGDPDIPGFFFCGAEPVRSQPYCAAHCERAYDQRVLQSLTRLVKVAA